MVAGKARTVVVDTDAWSQLFIIRGRQDARVPAWRSLLRGKSAVIALQTRAELLAGFEMSNWGAQRMRDAKARVDATPTVPIDDDVFDAFVQLTVDARRSGHGIYAKAHTGDRWIAATAIAIGAPLMSGDALFRGAPGLRLLDEAEERK